MHALDLRSRTFDTIVATFVFRVGRLVYEAVLNRDYPVLQAAFLMITVMVAIANIVADALYPFLDLRVRHAAARRRSTRGSRRVRQPRPGERHPNRRANPASPSAPGLANGQAKEPSQRMSTRAQLGLWYAPAYIAQSREKEHAKGSRSRLQIGETRRLHNGQ